MVILKSLVRGLSVNQLSVTKRISSVNGSLQNFTETKRNGKLGKKKMIIHVRKCFKTCRYIFRLINCSNYRFNFIYSTAKLAVNVFFKWHLETWKTQSCCYCNSKHNWSFKILQRCAACKGLLTHFEILVSKINFYSLFEWLGSSLIDHFFLFSVSQPSWGFTWAWRYNSFRWIG